jgi:hypothetical protein
MKRVYAGKKGLYRLNEWKSYIENYSNTNKNSIISKTSNAW